VAVVWFAGDYRHGIGVLAEETFGIKDNVIAAQVP
jgi:hypothetical protein